MNIINNIIFDLDGTLWDSRKQIIKAWKKILDKKLMITINEETLSSVMGKSNEEFKNKFFSNVSTELADNYLDLCQKEEIKYLTSNGANIYTNSISTIKELSNSYNLFIVSNCQRGYIESFLNHYNLNEYFDDYECSGTTGFSKKDNIKLIMERNNLLDDNTCYVGDTIDDYNSASENNIMFIYANYGFGNFDKSEYSIFNISEIINLLSLINK